MAEDSDIATQLSGGFGQAGWVANVGGLSGTSGLLVVDRDSNGAITRRVERRVAANTAITMCASAASGAATFSQAAGPIGGIVGSAAGMVSTALKGGLAAYDGQKAIAQLKQIQMSLGNLSSKGSPDLQLVAEALDYCIGKQSLKRNKGLADASIVGQPGNAFYKGGKAIYKFAKGTKGVNRAVVAKALVQIAKKNSGDASVIARRIIEIVAANNFENILTNAVADSLKSG
ncbi:hypothetical protein [Pseudomonas caspiana]|uniref:Uncharacterized protein n=1 Tax=Pseudomonas caspiana TaxID=1451454 RepID=A0A1Y3P6I7_9PSED|nr:hypothetical protein [Pseudomonas caspiana]OUM72424.1 hypothetical protein AUC60_17775 [Pseudomonas caspiana]